MKFNFSKKALALVMAVLMIMSSATAFAFAAEKTAVKAAALVDLKANENIANNINNNVNTDVKTVIGKFRDDTGTPADVAKYYHNVLYSPVVVRSDNDTPNAQADVEFWFVSGIQKYNVNVSMWFSKNSVLMYDGTEPTTGIMYKHVKSTTYGVDYMYGANTTNSDVSLVNPYWRGDPNPYNANNRPKPNNFQYEMNRQNSSGKPSGVIPTKLPSNKNDVNVAIENSNNYRMVANVLKFNPTFDSNSYFKDIYVSLKFGYWWTNTSAVWKNQLKFGTLKSSTPIRIINYVPLKNAINEVLDEAALVKANPGKYTTASVNELNRIADLLNAAKPDFSNIKNDAEAFKACETYQTNVIAQLKDFEAAKQADGKIIVEAHLKDQVQAVSSTLVLDTFLPIRNYDAYASSKEFNTVAKLGVQVDKEYVAYAANLKNAPETNASLDAIPEGFTTINTSADFDMKSGRCSVNALGQVSYTANKIKFDEIDKLYLVIKFDVRSSSDIGTFYKVQEVSFVPANSIYVEDDANAFTYGGNANWVTEGRSNVAESAAKLVGSGEVYGHSDAYANCNTYSAGAAHVATLTQGQNATVNFSFKGTGFDVISVASSDTGAFIIDVKGKDIANASVTKKYMMNTFSGWKYVDGQWTQNDTNANVLYQIPAIKITDLPYGNYDVTIKAVYSKAHDGNRDGSYKFIFDGVRIYNPINEDANSEVKDIYNKDNEANAVYTEFNTILASVGSTKANGVTITGEDGKLIDDEAINIVNKVSPNHELYIAPGHILSFKLNTKATPASVQVGAKVAGDTGSFVTIDGYTRITTSTAMYYKLEARDGVYSIYNTGDAVLSLTNIKCTFSEPVAANAVALVADAETPRIAYAVAKAPSADLSVKAQAPVVNDKTVTINAVTSLDVEKLNVKDAADNTVDAKVECTVNGNVKNWTVTIEEEAAGTYSYVISGEYAYGYTNASKVAKVTVTVKDAEAPAPQLTFGQKVVNFLKKIFGIKF